MIDRQEAQAFRTLAYLDRWRLNGEPPFDRRVEQSIIAVVASAFTKNAKNGSLHVGFYSKNAGTHT